MFYNFKEKILSDSMCQSLIDKANSIGFSPSTVNMYGQMKEAKSIRNNTRIEYTDTLLSKQLEVIINENFPEVTSFKDKKFSHLNNHFRFYHYCLGEFFKPHKDGHIKLEDTESLITVLFYLNDTTGGETILMPEGYAQKEKWITITPTKGSILLFEHNIWHEGKTIISGEKIVLRSDLFYPA